jgi:hypothetical protein
MSKRKIKAADKPIQYLHLLSASETDVTRESDPEDVWGQDSTSTSWDIEGIALSDKDGSDALPADFDIKIGDTIFVVYLVYSTGDTFHQADGAYLEVLSFHKNEAVARKNLREIEGRKAENFVMTIELDNGNKIERVCSWDGYFESLDYARCESFVVTEKTQR